MELYQEILAHILQNTTVCISFPELKCDISALVEQECYQALQKIQAILRDDRLDDAECFQKIEEIVCVIENLGGGCGTRHDFG
ncbi:hypothetical protein [Flavonifractor sp. An112]|uniref:hypothetical protein n=1 Tax=Flavonifractor sp. An112 TaxID=1965544 RepID=UPI000B3A00A0|nr:hypothetical protein [Flavonifractor sp. An112]OUQ57481.1 hypothetical protein B5E56_11515 [Flavonifractor sp. An112]HIZ94824.1 hypothetical protein [Candidatus Flavonifractor avicola]